ncbi:MAG: hypothetical protein KY476_04075 [Planctomycetes bacterium]|nr:hypothetical protein [Planctomycetota bacterium]
MARVLLRTLLELVLLLPLAGLAAVGRFLRKPIDVGLGPLPLINNVYHKRALAAYGWSAETFVDHVYGITDEFDVRGDLKYRGPWRPLRNFLLFARCLVRYRCLYLYFDGGPLGTTRLLWRVEPWLLRLARVRVVVLAYGSDVQDMSRSPNLPFKHATSLDYPTHRHRRAGIAARIDLWTRHADHVVGGCEWVYYMHHWDTLLPAHFSIDTEKWKPLAPAEQAPCRDTPLRILHAPNHQQIKGTQFFVQAVEELRAEGVPVELVVLQRVANAAIREAMANVDVVADQLIVGWYAMFALEAMSMQKPVLCHLRADLEELYVVAGLLEAGELPIVNCSPLTVKRAIRGLAERRDELADLGRRSRAYVLKHHSLEAVGEVFDGINRRVGLVPGATAADRSGSSEVRRKAA